MLKERHLPAGSSKYILYLANLLLYGFTGLYYCFISLYVNQIHSYSVAGILLAIPQGIAIFAPLFWGVCADKARYKKTVLLIMMLGVTICYTAVPISDNFIWIALALALTMFFLSALGSVLDVIGMEVANTEGVKYGPMRLMGMFGYGFVAFGLSFFIGDNLDIIFYVCAVLGLICCVCIGFMPGVRGYANAKNKLENKLDEPKARFTTLLKDKNLLMLIIVLATAQFAYGYYLNFFPAYLTEELRAPSWLWGTNVLITTLSEAPFYVWFDTLFKRFGIKKIVPFVLGATAVRYLLLSLFTGIVSILAIALFTGMLSVALLYSVQFFVNKNINPSLRAQAQTLVYAIGVGIPRMLAGVVGGVMTEFMGTNISMLISSIVVVVGLVLYVLYISTKKSAYKEQA